jgi:predicted exporter
MDRGSQFFRMPGQDKIALGLIIVYTLLTFALIGSPAKIAGISVFGWLMGAMMFLAPIFSLVAMRYDKDASAERSAPVCKSSGSKQS